MKSYTLFITLLTTLILTLNGCSGGGGNTETPNQAPTANAGADRTVEVNHSITITGSGTDSDGTILSFQWKKGSTVLANSASFEYAPTTVGTDTLTLTVTDNDGATNNDTMNVNVTVANTISITNDYQVESLGTDSTINTTISIDTATSKSLYLVLSNYANISGSTTIIHDPKVIEAAQPRSISLADSIQKPVILRAPQHVQDFNAHAKTLFVNADMNKPQAKTIAPIDRSEDVEGEEKSFCVDIIESNGNCKQYTDATARKVVTGVTTHYGAKTLNIWVSDNSFGSGCPKSRCVTQDMVDELANTFLSSGLDNDIYDWVTNIYEEEWGSTAAAKYSNLIGENNEITILLTDIDEDNKDNGGIVGFFWSKDNFDASDISGSNERVMFYIDAVMLANTDSGNFWQKEIYSTLAHEFQHMINFYQKYILLETSLDTWINEMLSETTEDLVATKIQHIGPRAVDYLDGSAGDPNNSNGRYPLFNENNTISLTTWNNQLEDYSKVSAFGTYIIRNYGGAKLLHDIMHNTYADKQAVVDAVNKSAEGSGKTFDNLLSEWGIAVILSTIESPEDLPTYNTGDFTNNTYNSTTYNMGSINFFNYDPLPTIHTTAGIVQAQGNYYYKIGDNLTGDVTLELELNGQTEATLIAK